MVIDSSAPVSALQIAPADAEWVQTAFGAWQRFGKGQHRAGLNFGDCLAYALAMRRGDALLFKGNDFSHPDVPQA